MESFRNINPLDSKGAEGPTVNNEFMSTESILICKEDLVVRLEAFHEVVCIEEGELGGFFEAGSACS